MQGGSPHPFSRTGAQLLADLPEMRRLVDEFGQRVTWPLPTPALTGGLRQKLALVIVEVLGPLLRYVLGPQVPLNNLVVTAVGQNLLLERRIASLEAQLAELRGQAAPP